MQVVAPFNVSFVKSKLQHVESEYTEGTITVKARRVTLQAKSC